MKHTSLEERAAQIAAKIAAGHRRRPPEVLANSERRRTPEKRALLERIARIRAQTEDEYSGPSHRLGSKLS